MSTAGQKKAIFDGPFGLFALYKYAERIQLEFYAVRWSMDLGILALWHSAKALQHETSYAHGHKCGLCQTPCLTFEYSTSAIYRRRHTARGEGLRRRGHMNSSDWPR
jgi:hypothetical protein